MRWINRKSVVIAGILLVSVVVWILRSDAEDQGNVFAPTVSVSVSKPERKDVSILLEQSGNVIAYETVAVRSRLDSQIMSVAFKNGDVVEKGALLFVLDDRASKAEEKQLAANVMRDRAQLDNLRQQYQRSIILTQKKIQAKANLDQTKAAFLAQEATVGASQAALDAVRVQLAYTRITSPLSGRAGTIRVTAGNTVKANDTESLVTINQIQPIRVQMALPQNTLSLVRSAIKAGEVEVLAQVEGVEMPVKGWLEYMDNMVDQSTGTYSVRAIFPNEDEALWPGMFIQTTLVLGTEKQALVIPEVAVQHGQEGNYVFVVEADKAIKRAVTVTRMEAGFAVIAAGLKDGESIVTDGLMSLRNNATVSISEADKAELP